MFPVGKQYLQNDKYAIRPIIIRCNDYFTLLPYITEVIHHMHLTFLLELLFVPNFVFCTIIQKQGMFIISVENMRKLDIPSSNYSQGYASAALWSSKFGIFLQSCLTEVRDQRKKVMMIGVIKNDKRFIFNFYYDCILVRLI